MLSVGLGAVDMVASEAIAESLGMEGKVNLIRLCGAREMASGVACLSMNPPKAGIWSRLVGDALDIALLAGHMGRSNPKRGNVGLALAAVLGVTVMDAVTAAWLCEGRDGPITRFVRGKMGQLERHNEDKMREIEHQTGQYASELAAHAAR
jgi:hypothetical protein